MDPIEEKKYTDRERAIFHADLDRAEQGTKLEKRQAAREWAKDLAEDPKLIAERIGWLLNGNYGKGSYDAAREWSDPKHKGRNVHAWLTQTIAALEWSCSKRLATVEWKKLTPAQKAKLSKLIQAEVDYVTVEMDEEAQTQAVTKACATKEPKQ